MKFLELMTQDLVGQLSLFTVGFAIIAFVVVLPAYFFIKSGQKKDEQK